jgi:Fe2+ transport system protein FeoA
MLSSDEKGISAKSFKLEMHKTLSDTLASAKGLNRQQRRKFGRKSTMVELLRSSDSTWGRKRADYGDFPVSNEIVESHILERFMKGLCSDKEFETKMNAWLSDPAEFSRIAYDYADQPNMIDASFGKTIDNIERLVNDVHVNLDELRKSNEARLDTRKRLMELGMGKSEAVRITKQIALPEFNIRNQNDKLEAMFGVGRAGHFDHYFSRMVRKGYSFKRSDVMDVMQMCYAYDCQLFRCDKAMADTFKDFEPFKGKLVGRFSELPERVSALLS